ncbi:uncharacterized protein LOC143252575 [Tachypleus tridentatus]|uniref:uncharacterized protein LOC143252575 n=1 Tax=Tachypleus tridentatus TaxID=6853 RepID=UPI003FD3DD01
MPGKVTKEKTSQEEDVNGRDNSAYQGEELTGIMVSTGQHPSSGSSGSSDQERIQSVSDQRSKPSSQDSAPIFREEHRQRVVVSMEEESSSSPDMEEQRGMVNFAYESEEERDSDKSTVHLDEAEMIDKIFMGHDDSDQFTEDYSAGNESLANGHGKVLNKYDHTEIAIPDDTLINYNTGRVRIKKKQKSQGSPMAEKIPLGYIENDLSSFTNYCESDREVVKETPIHKENTEDDQKEETIADENRSNTETNGRGKFFEEYFIPDNTHKKLLRGEKLYLAKNKKSKSSWKRVILCGLITIIIAVALLVAVLAATGILLIESNITETTKKPDIDLLQSNMPGSRESPNPPYSPLQNSSHLRSTPSSFKNTSRSKPTTMPPPSTTIRKELMFLSTSTGIRKTNQTVSPTITIFLNGMSIPVRIVPNAVRGVFNILDLEFKDSLLDRSSYDFVTLATELELELKKIFTDEGNVPDSVRIISFEPGNVVVHFTATWNQTHALSAPAAQTVIQRYLQVNDEIMARHHISSLSVKVEEVFNECEIQNGGCSHQCTWSDSRLMKTCSCSEGYKLEKDGQTCTNQTSSAVAPPDPFKPNIYTPPDGEVFSHTITREMVSSSTQESAYTTTTSTLGKITMFVSNQASAVSENILFNPPPTSMTTIIDPTIHRNKVLAHETKTERPTTSRIFTDMFTSTTAYFHENKDNPLSLNVEKSDVTTTIASEKSPTSETINLYTVTTSKNLEAVQSIQNLTIDSSIEDDQTTAVVRSDKNEFIYGEDKYKSIWEAMGFYVQPIAKNANNTDEASYDRVSTLSSQDSTGISETPETFTEHSTLLTNATEYQISEDDNGFKFATCGSYHDLCEFISRTKKANRK